MEFWTGPVSEPIAPMTLGKMRRRRERMNNVTQGWDNVCKSPGERIPQTCRASGGRAGMKRKARLLSVILSVAVLGLGGCSRAVPGEEEKVDTEVAVQVGTLTKTALRARVEAYGMVEPEPAKAGHAGGGAKLAAPIVGIVVAVHVIEGQSVKAGDVVVELDDRMAQAAVDKAQHALVFAQQVVDRQTRVLAFGGDDRSRPAR
jgi:multidrug efflux pump subunit AcrA (membrane-fusion protein)